MEGALLHVSADEMEGALLYVSADESEVDETGGEKGECHSAHLIVSSAVVGSAAPADPSSRSRGATAGMKPGTPALYVDARMH